ncbi:hypothetical protein BI362_03010 [Streptococcus parauberis]|nr:hypothetical protein BI362_03010 [Streptococcus parauberis]QBX18256.1 hypothetical protein Javan407_0023 [Streptococcus phage Javan407]
MIPKFRAWGKNGNYPGTPSEKFEMFYDVSIVTTYQDKEQHVIADFGMYNESEYNGTEIIDYTLMQSTGLFDKNDVEIFEWDIVVNQYGNVGYIAYLKQEAGFVVVLKKSDYRLGHRNTGESYDITNNHKIIGNIYENPDLLESVEE